jgi:hypothetical protein
VPATAGVPERVLVGTATAYRLADESVELALIPLQASLVDP